MGDARGGDKNLAFRRALCEGCNAIASKAFSLGARLEDILNAADWSSDSMFKRFYFKPVLNMASLVVDKLCTSIILASGPDIE